MKSSVWFPRSLWLAAWSFWLWLGFGLYRELPRDLGPVVCKLPLEKDEEVAGFVADLDAVICISSGVHGDGLDVRVLEARTGAVRLNYLPEVARDRFPVTHFISFRHGFLVWDESKEIGEAQCRALDLRTGSVVALRTALDGWTGMADQSPWLLTYAFETRTKVDSDENRVPNSSTSGERDADRVEVVDLRNGESVFSWTRTPMPDELLINCCPPFFTADGTMIVIPALSPDVAKPTVADLRLEFYAIDDSARPKAVLAGVTSEGTWCTSKTGRIVCRRARDQDGSLLVYEIASGRLVAVLPAKEPKPDASGRDCGLLTMAPDGSAVLELEGGRIWSVESRCPIWHHASKESFEVASRTDIFGVAEDCPEFLEPVVGTNSFSVRRRLPDGQTVFRTAKEVAVARSATNAAQTLYVSQDGVVRSFPPRVNYPLLALCQTILALPLVLLWAVLRWRRKRKLRLAGVAP